MGNSPNPFRCYGNLSHNLLVLAEAGIPGQEGLRTPLAAPAVRLVPGVGAGVGVETGAGGGSEAAS